MTWLYLSIQFQKLKVSFGCWNLYRNHSFNTAQIWMKNSHYIHVSLLFIVKRGNNSVNKYLLINLHQSGAMIVMNKRGVNFWHRLANVVERRWSLWWVCLVIKNTVYERFRLNRMLEKYLLGTQTEVDQSWKPLDKWGHKLLPVVTASGE